VDYSKWDYSKLEEKQAHQGKASYMQGPTPSSVLI